MHTNTTRKNRRKREGVETPQFAAMMRRMIRAHGRRVAEADPEDLAELVALRDALETTIADTVRAMHDEHGWSWTELGRGLGTSRQGAQQRYGS